VQRLPADYTAWTTLLGSEQWSSHHQMIKTSPSPLKRAHYNNIIPRGVILERPFNDDGRLFSGTFLDFDQGSSVPQHFSL